MRTIWTLVLVAVAWWVWRRWVAARAGREASTGARAERAPGSGDPASALPPAPMVRCAHCGVHLPQADALLSQGRPYCSSAHRDAAERVA